MKKIIRITVVAFLVFIVALIGLHFFAKTKISNEIEDQAQKNNITYKNLSINLLGGNISLDSLYFPFKENTIKAAKIQVKGVSYWTLLAKKDVKIDKVSIDQPVVQLQEKEQAQERDSSETIDFDQKITLKEIEITNGSFLSEKENTISLEFEKFDAKVFDLKTDKEQIQQNIPLQYGDYQIEGSGLTYLMNQLQTLKVDRYKIDEKDGTFKNFEILPNYTREKYVEVIPYEKDLMDISIDQITLKDYVLDLETENGKLTCSVLNLAHPKVSIYRDKLVEDDPNEKQMYSRMLRELDFKIGVDELNVENAHLSYEEVQEKTEETGQVFFDEMNVKATDITNIDMNKKDFPRTNVTIENLFYGTAPMKVNWNFAINDPEDHFSIKGAAQDIPLDSVNKFFVPAYHMQAKGKNFEQMDFDYQGDYKSADGLFKLVYEDLEIEALKKDGESKNKFVSFFADLFTNDSNKAQDANDQEVEISDVERDDKRSFWNYFWTCTMEGLKKTIL